MTIVKTELSGMEDHKKAVQGDIARRAYALYEFDDFKDGLDVDHWFRAQRELTVPMRDSAASAFCCSWSVVVRPVCPLLSARAAIAKCPGPMCGYRGVLRPHRFLGIDAFDESKNGFRQFVRSLHCRVVTYALKDH